MQKLKFIFIGLFFLTLVAGCQTIKDKTDAIVEKENVKLSEFIGKDSTSLQMELGKPDEDFKNDKGNLEFVYNCRRCQGKWCGIKRWSFDNSLWEGCTRI